MTENRFNEIVSASLCGDRPAYTVIFHHVRRIPYGAVGSRDPMTVLARNVGSCSGKHSLLRNLLVAAGYEAEVMTIRAYFNRGIPEVPSMCPELRELIVASAVPDFHHYVRLHVDGKLYRLDATWDDSLIHYGFPVNHLWDGGSDTRLAAMPIYEFPERADLAAFKEDLLKTLPDDQQRLRARFFALLTDWMASIRTEAA